MSLLLGVPWAAARRAVDLDLGSPAVNRQLPAPVACCANPVAASSSRFIRSDHCGLTDLVVADPDAVSWGGLGWTLGPGWSREWLTWWRVGGREVVVPVRVLGSLCVELGTPSP